jgi:TldD protein
MPDYFQREFGVSDDLCHRALAAALARGGDFADLYFEHTVSNTIVLEDGRVNRALSSVDLGVGIRTVKGDQVGYGFTQELSEQAMLDAAAIAATIADGPARTPSRVFRQLKTDDHYPMNLLMSEVPLASKLPLVERINERCFALSSLVVKVTAHFHDQEKRIMVVTSDGVKAEDLLPRNFLAAVIVAEKDGQREQAWHNLGGRRQFDFYNDEAIEKICSKAVRDAEIQFEAVPAPAGEMPVVLGARVVGVLLHEAVGHGLEADFNRKDVSTYATMIGKKVAEPFVTVIDDGTIAELLGSINVDDEGTPSQRTILVDKGILTSYMHDKISARHYGLQSTGNGRRESYRHHVMPRMRNTLMLAGPAKPEDLVRQAGNGIYVEDVSNGEVKIGEGDFSFYVTRGRMIENGKLTAPIKDINIMGNGPKMLQDITLVADDVEFSQGGTGHCGKSGQRVPVGDGQPSCLTRSLTVGGVTS